MKNIHLQDDTIAAISTPKGVGGIGIIRISGSKALNILGKIFQSPNTDFTIKSRIMNYGHIINPKTKDVLDEVLAVYMKAPTTYTGEDIVEINCHGGIVPLKSILKLIIDMGASPAEPGEFTKKAFLNGRLDLSQAEAVMDLISAKTDKTFTVAMSMLEGNFSKDIKALRQEIADILVNLTVNIDYPDEDIEELTYSNIDEGLQNIFSKLEKMIKSSKGGKFLRDGFKVAIIGKPNVGKSSLMNRLLNENRAIVTEVPGTTRDTIEETLDIRGIPVVLTDTAGIRETDDIVEQIGIEKSKIAFNKADLVIFILDASRDFDVADREILEYANPDKTIVLCNKTDLSRRISNEAVKALGKSMKVINTSMEDGVGIEELKDEIENMAGVLTSGSKEDVVVTNLRHERLLDAAFKSIEDAIASTEANEPLEFIEIDVNAAYGYLGEIIGEAVQGDIIDQVFSRFCLGK